MPSNDSQNLVGSTVRGAGGWVTALLANPLNIPREQSPEQFLSTLRHLASNEGSARMQRLLFIGCMCLVASLGSAMMSAIGIPTFVGPFLSAIALIVAYFFLRLTPWLVWIGSDLRKTSVFRAQFCPSLLKQVGGSDEDASTSPSPQFLGLDGLQIYQLIAWVVLWITCIVVVTKGAPKADSAQFRILALMGLVSYMSVRVGMALTRLLHAGAAAFGGTLVGAAIVVFSFFWPSGGGKVEMFPLFVATVGLGAVWCLSLINYQPLNKCFIVMPRGGRGEYHFRTPDLCAFSDFLNPILFEISHSSSTVLVLRRASEKYHFHDQTQPISPLQHIYDIFDLTETQAVTCNFNLKQAGRTAKALKAATVPIQYGCHPRTPTSEEMKVILDEGAVGRFSEVFFHGVGLSATVSQWVYRAAQDWFSSDPLYQKLVDIQSTAKELADIAETLEYDPNSRNVRLENLRLDDLRAHADDTPLRHGAKTSIQLVRGDMATAEKLISAVRNEIKTLRQKLKEFPFKDALPSLQRQFEATMDEEFKGYDRSYKLLVSMLSLRITFFDLAELGDLEQEFKVAEEALRKRLEMARVEFKETLAGEEIKQRTMTEHEKTKFEFVSSHLPGDMTLDEVQTTLKTFNPTPEPPLRKQAAPKPVVTPTIIIEDEETLDMHVTRIDVKLKLTTLDVMRKAFAEKSGARIRFSHPGFEVAIIFTRDETIPEQFSIPLRLNPDTTKQPVITEIKVGVKLTMVEKMCRMFTESPTEAIVFSNPKSEMAIIFTRDDNIPGAFSIPERIYPAHPRPPGETTATGLEDDDQGPT